ncbi:hypothetical protein VTO42DRAFT_1870 [Malbranchea cinnamomea]
MPIRALDEWANARSQTLPLSALKGAAVGIHASYYLDQHLNHHITKEPLLGALGGFPFAQRANIERELQALKDQGITPVFVFDGLEVGKPVSDLPLRAQNARAFERAWELYDQQQADQVVDAFSNAGSTKPETLYKFLQRILRDQGIEFLVAPYSASAQLAYLGRGPNQFVDAIFGPSELLLFEVDKVITRLDTDLFQFSWITKYACQEELGKLTSEQFVELCLLLGSPFLRTFPPFENPAFPGKGLNLRDAVNIFNGAGRNALALCAQFEEDRRVQELQYSDHFKRAFMTVKHHIIMDLDGKVGPLDPDNASSDLHELIGQRLPEELYFYISKGILGPQVPGWLTSGEMLVELPLGTEDSPVYRRLAGELLTPIRIQSLCLLSNSLHRFYQTKVISQRMWYEEKAEKNINLKDMPSVKDSIIHWRVRVEQLPETTRKSLSSSHLLTSSLSALKEPNFPAKPSSIKDLPPLSSKDDIISNVMWRFLQLRGYIDDKRELTQWGEALESALSSLDPTEKLEEPTFLAVEMIRLGILNKNDWFPNISGGPLRGTDDEKAFNLLISRVACFAKLRHKPIGYSGPLSRQLLSFRSLIYLVRSTLRILIEVVLSGLLLGGEADRDRNDWTDLSLSLPFIDDHDCGLGIAVRTYLDDLPQQSEPTSPAVRAEVKAKGKEWFQHSIDFAGNLDMAFRLWDAVYRVSQTVGKEIKDAKFWQDANAWLRERR